MIQEIKQSYEIIPPTEVQIKIKVLKPLLDPNLGYTTYLIQGSDQNGQFQIRRRFSQFFYLRQALKKYWLGAYIPPIPSKKIIGNKQEKIIDDRRKQLQYFCVKISQRKHMYYCRLFKQFLRNKIISIQKLNEEGCKPLSQIVEIYKNQYSEDMNKFNINDLRTNIITFRGSIQEILKQLIPLKQEAKQINQYQIKFDQNFNQFNTIIMPEYQNKVLNLYIRDENKLPFSNDRETNKTILTLKQLSQNYKFQYLVDLISFEINELKAMIESIELIATHQQKFQKLEQKNLELKKQLQNVNNGKTTFQSIFKRSNKKQRMSELEKSIVDNQLEIQNLDTLLKYNIIVVGGIEIPKLIIEKISLYYQVLSYISKGHINYFETYESYIKNLIAVHKMQ